MAKSYKFQVELNSDQLRRLNELEDMGDFRTKKDLFDNALTLLKWAFQRKKEGEEILSIDPDTESARQLEMPILQHVQEKYARERVSDKKVTPNIDARVPA